MIHCKPVITHQGFLNWPQAQKELVGKYQEMFTTNADINDYVNIMKKLESDKDYYNEISAYNKDRADTLYNYQNVAKEYIKVYEGLM